MVLVNYRKHRASLPISVIIHITLHTYEIF
jgi:hypothetical protein